MPSRFHPKLLNGKNFMCKDFSRIAGIVNSKFTSEYLVGINPKTDKAFFTIFSKATSDSILFACFFPYMNDHSIISNIKSNKEGSRQ